MVGTFLQFPVLCRGRSGVRPRPWGFLRVLSARTLITLGEMSFALYMTHQVIFNAYILHLNPHIAGPDIFGLTFCLFVIFAASFVLWQYIEMPTRDWMRKLLRRQPWMAIHSAPA